MKKLIAIAAKRVDVLSAAYKPNVKALGIFRILYALSIIIWPTNLLWIKDVPTEFYHPGGGIPSLLGSVPPDPVISTLMVLQVATAAWLLVGWNTRLASAAVVVTSILSSSLVYSFSKVDHTIFYELVPLVMAFAGWGGAFAIDARKKTTTTDGYPLVVMSLVLAFGWFTAAAAKLSGGWWKLDHYGAWNYVATDVVIAERPGILADFALANTTPLLWKVIDWGTLFAEGWVILAVLSPTLLRVALLILPVFHLSVFLMMDIRFGTYIFVYAPFFLSNPKTWFRPLAWRRRQIPSNA